MAKTITISEEKYKMLWGHLTEANKLLQELGEEIGRKKPPAAPKKRKTIADYMRMIDEREAKKMLKRQLNQK